MTLTLVTGPANSAKAGEIFGAYAEAARRGAVLVVPTAQDARHYERELASDPERPVALGTVLTFDGLVELIAVRTGVTGRPLTALQRSRVLRAAVAAGELDTLAASARGAGFTDAAGELVAELQRALVTPQRFTAALRTWAAQDVRRAGFARDVGRIYAGYARELERLGRRDRDGTAWRAIDALRAGGGTAWGTDAVFVYGFDDLTALECDALEALAAAPGGSVTVSLTYEPGRAALLARAGTVEALRPLAAEVVALPAADEHYAPGSREVLHRLERELFEPAAAPPVVDHDGSVVTLLEAGGERAEAELVAARVRALILAGCPAGEIAVVHRHADAAAAGIARAFSGYGVALARRGRVAFAHTPLGRALLGALRCAWAATEASAEDLLAYVRAPGLLREPELADAVEAELRRGGLTGAAAARDALAQRGIALRELDSLAAVAPDPAWEVPRDPGPELRRLAARLLAAPHRARAAVLDPPAALDARALAALHDGLAQLAELGPVGRPGPLELCELLAGLPVALAPAATEGEVALLAPAEVRARRFRAVFVCGLQEGEFPAPGRPEPFLSDARRRELALAAGLVLRPREDQLAAERALFYAAVSRATERVFLAYRSSDEEGNLAPPSPFLADVEALLGPGWRATRQRRLLPDVTWPESSAPTSREVARAQAAARAPLTGDAPEPARRLGAAALAHVRHTRVVSAGALESYSDCPVRWLVESQLSPAPLAPQPEPLARGSLIHAVLEALVAALGGPVTPENLERAQALLADELSRLSRDAGDALGAGASPAVRAGALRAIEADVRRYLGHEARRGTHWEPVALERRFGFEDEDPGSLPALVLGEGETAVRVRGVIDRIDAEPVATGVAGAAGAAGAAPPRRRAIVRDYKSGTQAPNWPVARWGLDRRLQVALYLLVARELAGVAPVAGVYQPLRGEDLRARGAVLEGVAFGEELHDRDARGAAELDAALDDAAERATELAARLRAGEVIPCPQTCSREGCAHPAICRSG